MTTKKIHETIPKQETAILVSVQTSKERDEQVEEYLEELAFLASTSGAKTIKTFKQKLPNSHPRSYVGEGKLKEIADYATEHEIDMVIFDDELSPTQIRNLEQDIKCKILDRSTLILDIFVKHARTAQAKTQVELAQNQYLLPRLTRMWTHLQKQKGGIGMRGPGEREIETDRRAIRNRISLLKEKLVEIDRSNFTQRKERVLQKRVALVGYTNVGKSTIMNLIAKSDLLAENKLFATLDATTRRVNQGEISFLLSDTVGFIRKLPHQLIECFKSTLDEVREADLLIHVVDISHSNFEEQILVVNDTLINIGAGNKPVIMIFNKIDRVFHHEHETPEEALNRLKNTWMAKETTPMLFVSASTKINTDKIRELIVERL
jgi:GTP-binding protein HflX